MARKNKGRFKGKFKNFVGKAKNWASENLSKDKVMGFQKDYNNAIDTLSQNANKAPKFQLYNREAQNKGLIIGGVVAFIIVILVIFRKKIFK